MSHLSFRTIPSIIHRPISLTDILLVDAANITRSQQFPLRYGPSISSSFAEVLLEASLPPPTSWAVKPLLTKLLRKDALDTASTTLFFEETYEESSTC